MALDDSLIGRAVVRCPECDVERWYGYGECSACGAFLPGAEPVDRVYTLTNVDLVWLRKMFGGT